MRIAFCSLVLASLLFIGCDINETETHSPSQSPIAWSLNGDRVLISQTNWTDKGTFASYSVSLVSKEGIQLASQIVTQSFSRPHALLADGITVLLEEDTAIVALDIMSGASTRILEGVRFHAISPYRTKLLAGVGKGYSPFTEEAVFKLDGTKTEKISSRRIGYSNGQPLFLSNDLIATFQYDSLNNRLLTAYNTLFAFISQTPLQDRYSNDIAGFDSLTNTLFTKSYRSSQVDAQVLGSSSQTLWSSLKAESSGVTILASHYIVYHSSGSILIRNVSTGNELTLVNDAGEFLVSPTEDYLAYTDYKSRGTSTVKIIPVQFP